MTECHPDRKHYSKGLCNPCYQAQRRGGYRPRVIAQAACHPDRTHYARGRCQRCYDWERGLVRSAGIPAQAYQDKLTEQGGVCAICGLGCVSGRRLAADHDHQTGEFRGLLCGLCNASLGGFRDDPILLERAIEYLSR
jgi:hypothetical protein